MPTALDWIHKRAKVIRRGRPKMKWSSAIKEASVEWNQGHRKVSGVKKRTSNRSKSPKRKVVHKKAAPSRARKIPSRAKKKPATGLGRARVTAGEQKRIYEGYLGEMMARHYLAKTKTEKKKIAKKITDIKRKLAAVGKLL